MNKSNPLVSVIIPTHNRKTLLESTVQSVLDQTYKKFEVIVIDNGSTDGTDSLFNNWNHPQIRYHWQEDTGGPASPRNEGVKLSRGEYIAFLDSDDLWLPQKLERQVLFLEEHKDYGMTFCNSYCFENSDEPKGKLLSENFVFDSSRQTEILIEWNVIPMLTVMVRKNCFLETGFFDEDPEINAFEDYDMWLRFSIKNKIGYFPAALSMYRSDGKRLSAGLNYWDKRLKVIGEFVAEFGHELSDLEINTTERINRKDSMLSLEYYWENNLINNAIEVLERICTQNKIHSIKQLIARKMISTKIFRSNKGFRFFIRRLLRYFLSYRKVEI